MWLRKHVPYAILVCWLMRFAADSDARQCLSPLAGRMCAISWRMSLLGWATAHQGENLKACDGAPICSSWLAFVCFVRRVICLIFINPDYGEHKCICLIRTSQDCIKGAGT